MARALVLVPVVLALLATGDREAAPADLAWWTTDGMEKVRPQSPPGPGREVRLRVVRNETEPFQLVLDAPAGRVEGVDVLVGDLERRGGGGRIDARWTSVYRVEWVELEQPSSAEGSAGRWPDPLVPRTDAYAGEKRAAFPFEVAAGGRRVVWIETTVPPGTPPGTYRGEVRVTAADREALRIPVELHVLPLELPSTSSLRTSFGFSGLTALRGHRGRFTDDRELVELSRLYLEAGLRHRISLHGGSMRPPDDAGDGRLDWELYDREMAAALDGTLLGPDDPLPGARLTSVDVRTPPRLGPDERVGYWSAWTARFRERGWSDRLFLYLYDEPRGPADYGEVLARGRLARRADPGPPTLLTEQRVAGLAEVVDVWVPLVQCFDDPAAAARAGCEAAVPREAYGAPGVAESVWWYQSCVSHGCNVVGGPATAGWPSYVVDVDSSAHRTMAWLAWERRIDGELYYNTVEAWQDRDPWRDVRVHGGNGDGTLFYPGTPERIGGSSHVPVESQRLKLIREGLEDHELLVLLEQRAPEESVRRWRARIARELAPGDGRPRAPGRIPALRRELLRELESLQPPSVATDVAWRSPEKESAR